MQVRIKGAEGRVLEALKNYPLISSVNAVGSREPGTIDLELAGGDGVDIREAIFACMSTHSLPILGMKSLDLTLEEIFLQITGEREEAVS